MVQPKTMSLMNEILDSMENISGEVFGGQLGCTESLKLCHSGHFWPFSLLANQLLFFSATHNLL